MLLCASWGIGSVPSAVPAEITAEGGGLTLLVEVLHLVRSGYGEKEGRYGAYHDGPLPYGVQAIPKGTNQQSVAGIRHPVLDGSSCIQGEVLVVCGLLAVHLLPPQSIPHS